jgi:hypothetical protein
MFRVVPTSCHDMNKTASEINFHLTETREKENGFVKHAAHRIVPLLVAT